MSLVTPEWLAAHLNDPDVRVCDTRWTLGAPEKGRERYLAGHIPGARFADLDRELSAPDDGRAGRHPLPDAAAFARTLAGLGLGPRTHVVAYDDMGGAIAARLWWMLRAVGHRAVSLLDGGIAAWQAAGLALESGEPLSASPTEVRALAFNAERVIDLAGLQEALAREAVTLLDARPVERYRGEVEPVDGRPGHIPGALSVPTATLLAGGRFLAPEALAERFRVAGVADGAPPVVASCGSGVTACHLLFALDLCGRLPFERSRLYPGSYSEWARQPALAVATGPAPR